jgi:hypothetical protein
MFFKGPRPARRLRTLARRRIGNHSSLGSKNLEVDVANLRQLAPDDTFQPVHLEKGLGFRFSLCYKPLWEGERKRED